MTSDTRNLVVALSDVEWRDAGDPERKGETTLRGHAAVFNSLSEDLGGFREIIEPGFFREALRRQPDVRLLVNHDGLPLARTRSGTLELREDQRGLHVFARLDKNDPDVIRLRGKMQRGDVDQMSFAFTLRDDADSWELAEDGGVVRTLRADGADDLLDVSVVTYPAYQATDVSMRSVLQDAISRGRLPDLTLGEAEALASDEDEPAVALDEGSTDVAEETQGEERDAAPEAETPEVDVEQAAADFAAWQASIRAARTEAFEAYLRLKAEHELA